MAGFKSVVTLILMGIFATFSTIAITLDEGLTRSLEDAVQDDEFAISVNHLKTKKLDYSGKETLIATKYTNPEIKFLFMLDRHTNRIILETVEENNHGREDIVVGSLNITVPMKNIILIVHQTKPESKIDVYVDCNMQGVIPMKKTFRDVINGKLDDTIFRVYRERKYRMKIHRSTEINDLWERERCHTVLLHDVDNHDDIDHDHHHHHKMNNVTISRVRRRGDIGIHTLDEINCVGDSTLIKTLNELIEVTKRIWSELERNTQETRYVRKMIEECAACRPGFVIATTPAPPPPTPPRPSCRYQSPCFAGAQCRDTETGPECLSCPYGYSGDGRHCQRVRTCSDNPCHQGVRCQNTRNGYRCGPCPTGYTGNGEQCHRVRGCDTNPCHSSVTCHPLQEYPYYQCGACPEGYTGNGTNCQDIDECDLTQPCDPRTQCVNTSPGYRCEPPDWDLSN